ELRKSEVSEFLRSEQRKYRRRELNVPAKLDPGGGLPLRDCILVDISEMGARLLLNDGMQTPDDFVLLLTPSGVPRRRCRLVWRTTSQVGVEFDRSLPEHDKI